MSKSIVPSISTANPVFPAVPSNQPGKAGKPSKKAITRMLSDINCSLSRSFLVNPKKILKDGRVTVVFWADGTATAVKLGKNEKPDDYAAFCAAVCKKIYGNNTALKRAFMEAPTEVKELTY